jgi:hypothetical protein
MPGHYAWQKPSADGKRSVYRFAHFQPEGERHSLTLLFTVAPKELTTGIALLTAVAEIRPLPADG